MSRSSALAIFLIVVLLGPIFGAVVFGLLLGLHLALTEPGLPSGLPVLGSIIFIPLAYIVGGLQALATGVVASLSSLRAGRLSWLPALAVAAIAGAIHASREHVADDWSFTVILFLANVLAAALCLTVCRLMLGRGA